MNEDHTLIVPMLNTSEKYKDKVPIEFQYDNVTGELNCIKCLLSINISQFNRIYFIILKSHEEQYNVSRKLNVSLNKYSEFNDKSIIVSFVDFPTKSQCETIYNTIKKYNITGHILIKDADTLYKCDDPINGNTVMIYSMENLPLVDPQHKSYVKLDDQKYVINIIEKRIISKYFSCGGYSFNDADDFVYGYEHLLEFEDIRNHMYISHIIYYLMLYKHIKFKQIEATYYEDFEIKN